MCAATSPSNWDVGPEAIGFGELPRATNTPSAGGAPRHDDARRGPHLAQATPWTPRGTCTSPTAVRTASGTDPAGALPARSARPRGGARRARRPERAVGVAVGAAARSTSPTPEPPRRSTTPRAPTSGWGTLAPPTRRARRPLRPADIAVDAEGNPRLGHGEQAHRQVRPLGRCSRWWAARAGVLPGAGGLAVGPDGYLYVADTWNQRIQVLTPSLEYAGVAGYARAGASVVNKPHRRAPRRPRTGQRSEAPPPEFDAEGALVAAWGQFGADLAGMNLPTGLAADAEGRCTADSRITVPCSPCRAMAERPPGAMPVPRGSGPCARCSLISTARCRAAGRFRRMPRGVVVPAAHGGPGAPRGMHVLEMVERAGRALSRATLRGRRGGPRRRRAAGHEVVECQGADPRAFPGAAALLATCAPGGGVGIDAQLPGGGGTGARALAREQVTRWNTTCSHRDDGSHVKPDPGIAGRPRPARVAGAEAAMCGDHPMDIAAGRGVGACTVGCCWRAGPEYGRRRADPSSAASPSCARPRAGTAGGERR